MICHCVNAMMITSYDMKASVVAQMSLPAPRLLSNSSYHLAPGRREENLEKLCGLRVSAVQNGIYPFFVVRGNKGYSSK
jgi:hypothetical protein